MPTDAPLPPASKTFVIAVFAAAFAVGGLIIYLGVTGVLGGPIP